MLLDNTQILALNDLYNAICMLIIGFQTSIAFHTSFLYQEC